MAIENSNSIRFDEVFDANEYSYVDYYKLFEMTSTPAELVVGDTLRGFDKNLENKLLSHLNEITDTSCVIWANQIVPDQVKAKYPKLDFKLYIPLWLWDNLKTYNHHPSIDFKNFVCSFNGAEHISRKLLVAMLHQYGWFNPEYSSKNFVYTNDMIDGHIQELVGDQEVFYGRFFKYNDNFGQEIYTFNYSRFNHGNNIRALENKLTESFVHVVSESLSTSYLPFLTEKFLYSAVTRGLFLCFGQPGWHDWLEKYYGFKKYNKIFDYRFDSIQNPVERIIELMSMLSKFSRLSVADWNDLYQIERDTIEYNYNHYFSNDYLRILKKHYD
jgi:hypothetical protein